MLDQLHCRNKKKYNSENYFTRKRVKRNTGETRNKDKGKQI